MPYTKAQYQGCGVSLPKPWLKTKWTKAPAVLSRLEGYQAGYSRKGRRLRRRLMALNSCHNPDGSLHSVKIALVQDHPFLRTLNAMPHVPRAVKSLYRAEKRLAFYKATDAWWIIREFNTADEAWEKYQRHEIDAITRNL